jgi:nicotinamidase-related amidase
LPPAAADRERIAALGIDAQVAFCLPGASLFVPGAVEDTRRTVEWLYRNLGRITSLFFTLDTHTVHQVFHPASWVDEAGRHPEPFTVIRADEVRAGRWRPALHGAEFPDPAAACTAYCAALEASGRYVLTIWPYHALLGGLSHALLPALMEAALFHAAARGVDPVFAIKGRSPWTENYSVFAPEVRELLGVKVGELDLRLLEAVLAHDRVYIFGQASSHCVLETLRDLVRACRARGRDDLLGRVHVLADAMSPVPPPPLDPLPPELDFPAVARAALDEFRAAGMRIVSTSDPL